MEEEGGCEGVRVAVGGCEGEGAGAEVGLRTWLGADTCREWHCNVRAI